MASFTLEQDYVNEQVSLLYMKLNAAPEMAPLEIRSLYEKAYRELNDADTVEINKYVETLV